MKNVIEKNLNAIAIKHIDIWKMRDELSNYLHIVLASGDITLCSVSVEDIKLPTARIIVRAWHKNDAKTTEYIFTVNNSRIAYNRAMKGIV